MVSERNVNLVDYLFLVIPQSISRIEHRDEYHYYCHSFQPTLINSCFYLQHHYNLQLRLFVDITAVDFLHNRSRFVLVYNLFSTLYNIRMLYQYVVQDAHSLRSVTKLFPAANWYEREIWDLFGLFFAGHPDLRRILTDYGFVGHPLKKDYPLSGYTEVHYDAQYKCIVYGDVYLIQDFRDWAFDNPWSYHRDNI